MTEHRHFLVVDDNPDSRFLLVKTLLRKFPLAFVQECQEAQVALLAAKKAKLAAIVAHRCTDVDGVTLIEQLREANTTVPIVLVSGVDRSQAALKAGATAFLNYDEWLRIGTVVSDILSPEDAKPSPRR